MSKEDSGRGVKPMASTSRDLKQLKTNSGAAASELRDFLAEMRGKSPKEMLGQVAQSSLLRSFFLATFLFVLILAAGTVAPYGWAKYKDFKAEFAPPVLLKAPLVEAEVKPEEKPAVVEVEKPKPPEDDPDALLDRLGVGEEKIAPLDVNPLENSNDDLFKDLE